MARDKSPQDRVRATLAKAGHGARQCDSYGGDGLLGFYTYPLDYERTIVGFTCDPMRFPDGTRAALSGPMLERYAMTLREAGYVVGEYHGALLAHRS